MGSNKTRLTSVRLSVEAATAIELEAVRSGRAVKEVLENFGIDISEGRLRSNGDSFIPSDEYVSNISKEGDYERLGFDRIKDAYESCGYPEHVIRRNNEMISSQIRDGGRFSAKKFSDEPCQ